MLDTETVGTVVNKFLDGEKRVGDAKRCTTYMPACVPEGEGGVQRSNPEEPA